jgi:hypothetical protein
LPRRYCEDLKHELSSELKILKDCATPILTEFADAPSVNPKYLREAYARKQNLVRMFDGERQSIPITNQYCMSMDTFWNF